MEKTRARNTYQMYRSNLEKFAQWYGATIDQILAERVEDWKSADIFRKKRLAQKVEEFHAHLLKKGFTRSSAATVAYAIRNLFAFYEMPLKVSKEVDHRPVTTTDFVPRVDQYARMFAVADNLRDKVILSAALSLAWRIGDFARLKRSDIDLNATAPVEIDIVSEKEDVNARSFLSGETIELIKEYVATLGDTQNPYLFPSNAEHHIDKSTLNRIVQALAKKANIEIPKSKHLRFHAFRKRFLSECANLRIDGNLAKILCGKNVDKAILTYIGDADLRSAFNLVSERLRLTEKKTTTTDTGELEKNKVLRMLIFKMASKNPDVLSDAAKELGITVHELMMTFSDLKRMKKKAEVEEKIIVKDAAKWKEQQKEYERLIAENNNNNDNGNGENGDA
jgi:integrase